MNLTLLVEDFKKHPTEALPAMRRAVESGQIKASEFDLGKLFAETFGWNEFVSCKMQQEQVWNLFRRLDEADSGVTTAAFQNISGQIVYAATLEKYNAEEFVFKKLIPEKTPTILDGEKIAGLTEIGNNSDVRKEGDPYKEVGIGEDWIYTPPVLDHGHMISITWETIFQDRTGQLMDFAGDVGYWIGYAEEVEAIDCVVDENVTAHRYNWRTAGQIATYNDNTGSHTWDNLAATNALVDWTDIDNAEQLFNGLTNPFTGTPIMVEPKHLIVTKQLEQTARRIVSASEIRVTTPGYATSANPNQAVQGNPYLNKYTVLTSRLLASRMATDTSWFLADVTKLAKRMVAEPLQVVDQPGGHALDFERRIVSRKRANKRYCHVTVQPRASVKSTA